MSERKESALPAMPDNVQTWIEVRGRLVDVSGRDLLTLPFAAPVGASRGRRYSVRFERDDEPRYRVVFNVGGMAALTPPPALERREHEITVWIRALPDRRDRRIPQDLAAALAAEDLVVEPVPEAELTQLIAMLNESATSQIRADRRIGVIQAIRHRNRHD